MWSVCNTVLGICYIPFEAGQTVLFCGPFPLRIYPNGAFDSASFIFESRARPVPIEAEFIMCVILEGYKMEG